MRPTLTALALLAVCAGLLLAAGCISQVGSPLLPLTSKSSPGSARGGGGGGGGGVPAPPPTPIVISTTSMPNGNIGSRYVQFITSSGGLGTPHQFRLVSGKLPSGLSMASSFGVNSTVVSGTPTTLGTSAFTVQVQDQTGHTATQALSITIDPPVALVINNPGPTLMPGTVGASYSAFLFAQGGIQPYTWAIVAGQLPPGLRLAGNIISGTPTTAGTFTFTARVSASRGQQASMVFSITIG